MPALRSSGSAVHSSDSAATAAAVATAARAPHASAMFPVRNSSNSSYGKYPYDIFGLTGIEQTVPVMTTRILSRLPIEENS